MKLIIQIPCYNEEKTLGGVLTKIPKLITGIKSIETLVIDDGSTDDTIKVASEFGATYIIRNTANLGLAYTFRRGLDECLSRGADIIVNIDADHQYNPSEIGSLVAPILNKQADMVIGDRRTAKNPEFSGTKKFLQWLGTKIVRQLANAQVQDAVSGFRAFSRDAALKLTILSNHSYTLESILQARAKGIILASVPITTNPSTRPSRLISSLRSYLAFSIATIIRVFTMYNPLRVFFGTGALLMFAGLSLGIRFLYYFFAGQGDGKVQSLLLAAILLILGFTTILSGLLADLIQFNRRLLEELIERVRRLEYRDK